MKVARATLPSDAFPTPLDCSYLYLPLRGYPLSIYQSVPENRTLAILRAIFPVIPYKITKSVNIATEKLFLRDTPNTRPGEKIEICPLHARLEGNFNNGSHKIHIFV